MKLAFRPPSALSQPTHQDQVQSAAIVVAVGGLAVTLVGLADLALLWLPLSFGDTEWEFATIGAHVIGMPLPTVGLTLMAAAAVATASRKWTSALSVASVLIVLTLACLAVLYGFAAQVAMSVNPPQVLPLIREAVVKTAVFLTVYALYFGWLGYYLFRMTRAG